MQTYDYEKELIEKLMKLIKNRQQFNKSETKFLRKLFSANK